MLTSVYANLNIYICFFTRDEEEEEKWIEELNGYGQIMGFGEFSISYKV